jgi:hypothetical protein
MFGISELGRIFSRAVNTHAESVHPGLRQKGHGPLGILPAYIVVSDKVGWKRSGMGREHGGYVLKRGTLASHNAS